MVTRFKNRHCDSGEKPKSLVGEFCAVLVMGTLSTLIVLAACAPTPPPVRVLAEPGDLAALAGEWVGEYSSATTGRSGSIVFKLEAGQDTAYGDVLMTPRGGEVPYQPATDPYSNVPPRSRPEVLTIHFVRIEGAQVSGTLTPYRDPETGASLFTTFEGELRGDTIEGTFVARESKGGRSQSGRWKVTRKRE